MAYVIAIDIGSTNIKCIAMDRQAQELCQFYLPIQTLRPEPGWVEIDPYHIWESTKTVVNELMKKGGLKCEEAVGIGITCQRNTFTLWRRSTGEPVVNFLSWQDIRTEELCKEWNDSATLKAVRFGAKILRGITHADKYTISSIIKFSPQHAAIRLNWVFRNMPNVLKLANQDDLCFGTIDTWLVYKLTNGQLHITDYSNAASTAIFDAFTMEWSKPLCGILGFPMGIFPTLRNTMDEHARTEESVFGVSIPIGAIVADQSASAFANMCWNPGNIKCTLGTGAFIGICHGDTPRASLKGYYPLVGWVDRNGPVFFTESNIASVGTTIEWAKSIGLCSAVEELSDLAQSVGDSNGVVFVPSFGGLPSPYNDYKAEGGLMGLSLRASKAHIVRAILEGLSFQIRDLYEVAQDEGLIASIAQPIICDGGVTRCDFLMQQVANLTGRKMVCPVNRDTTAVGAALMAGLALGFWKERDEIEKLWQSNRSFNPEPVSDEVILAYRKWKCAIQVTTTFASHISKV